jgi:hypothetical protein
MSGLAACSGSDHKTSRGLAPGAQGAAASGPMDGYWVSIENKEDYAPYFSSAMRIQGDQLFNLEAFTDGGARERAVGTLTAGADGSSTFKSSRGQQNYTDVYALVASDTLRETFTQGDEAYVYDYRRVDASVARAAVTPFPVRQVQDYDFAHNFCAKPELAPAVRAAVDSIRDSVTRYLERRKLTLAQLAQEREANTGEKRDECEITEDLLERGLSYTRGVSTVPSVYGGSVTPSFGSPAQDLTVLSSLELSGASGGAENPADLEILTRFPRLHTLVLGNPGNAEQDYSALLPKLTRLQDLALSVEKEGTFAQLPALRELRALRVHAARTLKSSELLGLAALVNLHELELNAALESPAPLANLTELRRLTVLRPLSDLAAVGKLRNLRHLSLEVDAPANLIDLTALSGLQDLRLDSMAAILDVSALAGLDQVTELNLASLAGDGGTLTGIDHLTGMARLRALNIRYSRFDDLQPLTLLLQSTKVAVSLEGCKLPPALGPALEQLRAAYPDRLKTVDLQLQ